MNRYDLINTLKSNASSNILHFRVLTVEEQPILCMFAFLQKGSFLVRLAKAIRYLFNLENSKGFWDVIVPSDMEVTRMMNILSQYQASIR